MTGSRKPGILDGVRIVDVSSYMAGPAAAAILADLGGDVIHVEPLGGDPVRSLAVFEGMERRPGRPTPEQINSGFELANRNKRGIAVNIGSDAGRQVLHDLVRGADVFSTNLLPGRLAALGLEYERLKEINPRLIYGAISGYGTRNPDRDRRAFDQAAFWARSGHMEELSEGAPVKPYARAAVGDQTTSIALAGAIGLALYHRERTGEGERVDVSLFRTGLWVMAAELQRQLTYGVTVPRGSRTEPVNPLTNYFPTGDGRWLLIHMPFPDKLWPRMCETLGRPDLAEDPRFRTHAARVANAPALVKELDRAFATAPRDEWGRRFDEIGVVWSTIPNAAEVEADPLLDQESLVFEAVHPATGQPYRLLNGPFDFASHPPELHRFAPRLGEHTDEVLAEIGYDDGRIAALRRDGIVG